MKGIILAGGSGTRLYPATKSISKQLMPVYDKPMIYYPLCTLMSAGIRDILIISTPRDLPMFLSLLGDGAQWGMAFSYAEQTEPRGLADAFRVGKAFIGKDSCAMILGDNLFYGHGLDTLTKQAAEKKAGATVFGYRVSDPERYGTLAFDYTGKPIDIIEKPEVAPSPWAVTGIYFYDNQVVDIAAELNPSARGELEITDLNREYLKRNALSVVKLERGVAWLDTGTHESLHDAAEFVRIVQQRQGLMIGCPEEIAFNLGYINQETLIKLAAGLGKTDYANYLKRLA